MISSGLKKPNWMPTIASVSELCGRVGIPGICRGFLGGGGAAGGVKFWVGAPAL